nr:MAG TPA: hypothetical protein [Caudoviricetes sp.]
MRLHELSRFAYLRAICILAPDILSCVILCNTCVQMFSIHLKIFCISYKTFECCSLNTNSVYILCNILFLAFYEYVLYDHPLKRHVFLWTILP